MCLGMRFAPLLIFLRFHGVFNGVEPQTWVGMFDFDKNVIKRGSCKKKATKSFWKRFERTTLRKFAL